MHTRVLATLMATASAGCATQLQHTAAGELRAYPAPALPAAEPASTKLDGSLASYVSHAMRRSAELRAAYYEWQASVEGIDGAYRLPEPEVRYTAFLRHIETRVGPQRHQISVMQMLPWPTRFYAAANMASAESRARGRRVEARALLVTRQVTELYWSMWLVDRAVTVYRQQLELLDAVAKAAEARIEIGKTTLADLAQVNVAQSRLVDMVEAQREKRRQLEAGMRELTELPPEAPIPVTAKAPAVLMPGEPEAGLFAAVRRHPLIESFGHMADAKSHAAERAEAEGMPGLSVGFTYFETGEAAMPGVMDSGKDPMAISFGVSIPVWRHVYGANARRARTERLEVIARRDAAVDKATAMVDRALARLRDSQRRVRLYQKTLLPQAQAAFESALGGYQIGAVTVATVQLGAQQLLELQLALYVAEAEHAQAWAMLEQFVGRKVAGKEVTS